MLKSKSTSLDAYWNIYPGENVWTLIQKLTVQETCTVDGIELVNENGGISTYWFEEVNSIPDSFNRISETIKY